MVLSVKSLENQVGTELAEHLRTIIKYYNKEDIFKQTEVMLIYAARAQHYLNVIKPALEDGYFVLCDRFIDSTFVYQGYCQGVDFFLLNIHITITNKLIATNGAKYKTTVSTGASFICSNILLGEKSPAFDLTLDLFTSPSP